MLEGKKPMVEIIDGEIHIHESESEGDLTDDSKDREFFADKQASIRRLSYQPSSSPMRLSLIATSKRDLLNTSKRDLLNT